MNISGIHAIRGISEQLHMINQPAEEVSEDLASRAAKQTGRVGTSLNGDAGVSNASSAAKNTEQVDAAAERAKIPSGTKEFADRYDARKTYDLVGKDASLDTLDVQKAISAMQKDSVLQQYQYFVGDAKNNTSLADLHPEENFDL